MPVGCVFVYKDEIIARASNRVNELYNVRIGTNTHPKCANFCFFLRLLADTLDGFLLLQATMHAEMVAMESIAATYGDRADNVLSECTLYVTCEPCIMCAGALANVFIKRVYFGCHNDRFGVAPC